MPTEIASRSRIYVGHTPDPDHPGVLTRTWRLGFVTEAGVEVVAHVTIQNNEPDWNTDFSLEPTDADVSRYEHELNTRTEELLDRLQEAHERPTGGSIFLDRYRVDWDTNMRHTDGRHKCECGMWHPEGSMASGSGSRFLQP